MTRGGRRGAWLALALVLAYVGWAGLRPFDFFRRNAAAWVEPGPGLSFDGGGMAVSRESIGWETRSGGARLGLEAWVRPRVLTEEARDLFVLGNGSGLSPLGLSQDGADLVFFDLVTNPGGERWYNDLRIADAFAPGVLHHVAVSSGEPGTRVWIDGHRVEESSGYRIPIAAAGEPLAGRVCVGSDPRGLRPWSGDLLGLALFDHELSDPEVAQHARLEPGAGLAPVADEPGCLALFPFDEGTGTVAHDLVTGGPELEIPRYFRPVGRPMLGLPPVKELTSGWNVLDVGVNLLGFVPLGFVLGVILASRSRAWVWVLLVALGVSLGIELMQSLSVSRDSSLVDLVMNVGGAVVGWGLCVWLRTSRGPGSAGAC